MLRKAVVKDIKQIQTLINTFAGDELMLSRSLNELYEGLRDFWVFVKGGRVLGCASLRISWDDFAEVRSVAVARKYQGQGIGKMLVEACLKEAFELGARKVFVLTYSPKYFRKFGFKHIKHSMLPHKIWAECIRCPKFPDCQETAMLKGISSR